MVVNSKIFFLTFCFLGFCCAVFAQQKDSLMQKKPFTTDTLSVQPSASKKKFKLGFKNILSKISTKKDTLQKPPLSPVAKAARKAALASAIVPGLGQAYNIYNIKYDKLRPEFKGRNFTLKKLFIGAKIAGIYTAEGLLVYSYINNRNDYRDFVKELQFRANNTTGAVSTSKYASIETSVLSAAKDNAARNREVSIFGAIATHALNIIDAYIDARLRFFNVDDDLSFQISPTIIPQHQGWALNYYPALKFTLKL